MNTTSEWDLIRRCRRGNAEAFEPLVRRYERRALATAAGYLGDADEAADAVQEAFVKAYRSLGRLEEGSDFGRWFGTILRNHCRDLLRSPHRSRRVAAEVMEDREPFTEPAALANVEREELSEAVRRALAELSVEHREILVLKEIEGLTYAGIAEVTGIPAGTVASRLYHARAALKKVMIARGISLEEAR